MPKCQKCYQFYPPDFMRDIEGTEGTPDQEDRQCVFCMLDKNVINFTGKNGKEEQYSKKQCQNDYKKFLKELKSKTNIAKVLAKGSTNVIK